MNRHNWTNEEKARFILGALKRAEISVRDIELIQGWLVSDDNPDEKARILEEMFDGLASADTEPGARASRMLEDFYKRVGLDNRKQSVRRPLYRRYFMKIAAIAIPFMVIAGTTFFLYKNGQDGPPVEIVTMTVPDSVAAPLKCLLPDSSTVWVKPGSSIRYPKDFTHERRVAVAGEACFSVNPQAEGKPFWVDTEKITVKVLGTEFSVREDDALESTSVVLHTGKVEILAGDASTLMNPGQMFSLIHPTGETIVGPIPADYTDWRFSDLRFDHMPISRVLTHLARYYMVEMKFPEGIDAHAEISIAFRGSESLREAMDILMALVDDYSYELEGRRATVSKR